MNKPLFTNVNSVKADSEKVRKFLDNVKNILKWDPEIGTVETMNNGFHISRVGKALNNEEDIVVVEESDKIIYKSSGGRLAYNLEFEIEDEGEGTQISQTLFIPEDSDLHLPVALLKPIAKYAFANNLTRITAVIDNFPN